MVDDKTVKIKRFDKTEVYPELNELKQAAEPKKLSKRQKIAIMAGGLFFVFLLAFFMAAYYHDEQLLLEQKKIHKEELAAVQKKQSAIEQKKSTEINSTQFSNIKDKAETIIKEVPIANEDVQQTVNVAERHIQKAVSAAQTVQGSEKVQAVLQDKAELVNQLLALLQEQKNKLFSLFDQTARPKQKADK